MSLYSQTLERVLLPAHGLLRSRHYLEHLRFLRESQWWSSERVLAFQWNELKKLLAHAFKNVPYYRNKYAKAGIALQDIGTWKQFAELPLLTRAEINAHRNDLCSETYRGRLIPHATGGSTGTPTRFFITTDSYDWRTACRERAYSWAGLGLGEPAAYLWGASVGPISPFKRLKIQAYHRLQNQLVINTFVQTRELWADVFEQLKQFAPKVVVGYVSSLHEFASFLKSEEAIVPGVAAVVSAAEPLDDRTRGDISHGFRAPVYNTYGSREFMSIAGECEQRDGLHINVENVVVEVQRRAEDGLSEIVITDLHNFGMPFIRYSIGDCGTLVDTPCVCGRGLPRIQAVEGRLLDFIKAPDGRMVPGEFFPHLFKEIPEIVEYRVEQRQIDLICILMVLSEPLSDFSRALLRNEIDKVLGPSVAIDLNRVSEIPRLRSGKMRRIIGLS